MKLTARLIILVAGICNVPIAQAQGTFFLSNLNTTSAGSSAVGSDVWIAQSFFSGTNSGGYALNSVQLRMDGASGSPSDFAVSIYSSNVRQPAISLGSLSGPNPETGGVFTYTTPGITLSGSTLYFVVATAGTPVATGSYHWSFADNGSYDASDRWTMGNFFYRSTDNSSWDLHFLENPFQLAIGATAVPEPRTFGLLGFGLVCLIFWPRALKKMKGVVKGAGSWRR